MLPTPNPTPRKAGRPRALDDTKRREICALISAGCGIDGAARYVGCAASTIHREAKRNSQFSDELRRSHLAAELSPLHAMRQAAATHWRAAAWLLERTNPQRFAKQNVRLLKPEQLQSFLDIAGSIIAEATPDPGVRERVFRELRKLTEFANKESKATLDPCPRARRTASDPKDIANRFRQFANPSENSFKNEQQSN